MALFDETPLSRTVREQSLGESDPYLRQYTPDLGGTAFRRGVDQSLGLGADYLGTVAEAAGAQDTARDLYGFSDRQMSEAQRQVAGPQTTGDVQGLGSAFEFGLNKAAESLPVSGTALGVAALSRSPSALGRIATAGAPIFPVVAGETSYSMRQDPNSTASPIERAVTATGAGAVSTALEVLPEVSAVGKLFNAAPSPAKTMAEAVLRGGKTAATSVAGEALTEGAQDVVSRGAQSLYNPEIGVNPVTDPEARQSFIESAAAGAAGGAVFGVPSGIATTLQGLPETQMPELPSGDALRQFIGETLTPRAERIAPEDIPANADDAVAAEMQRENTLTERARALRDRLMQRGDLTPEEQASIQDEVDLDPDAQEAVQNLADKKATEDTIRDSLSRIPTEGKPSRISPQVPLEEVDAIVKQAGIETEAASAPVRQWLSAYEPILKAGQVDSQTIDTALNVFGERGYSVLRAMAGDNQAALAVIDADQAQNGRLDTFLLQALKPEFRDSIRPGQLRQLGGLVRGAVDRGEGDIDSILETAFQNPQEVIAALQTGVGADTVGRGAATAETDEDQGQEATDDDTADVEYGDTQSIQDVDKRYFGNTRGNRRIKTGGLNIPWPMNRDKFADIVEVARNARGLAPESDVTEVPAVAALRELGVDPADVAAEMKITEQELRNMVFLQGSAPKPAVDIKTFVRMLKTSTIDKLNSEGNNPSAGSYLGIKSGNNHKAAIDVRKMVAGQVYGKRDAASLMSAFADGVSTALEQGYKLDGPIPDNLVLARYGRGSDETVVTVGSARKELTKASKQNTDENFSLDPETFATLRQAGYNAGVDPRTGELQLPRSEVIRAIEAYAASVADRTAAARGIAKPAWVQKLIAKYGTNFPAELGRASDRGSIMSRLRGWAIDQKIDSKALNALRVNAAKEIPDVALERQRYAKQRQGPAMGGGTGRSTIDERSGIGAVIGKDLPLATGKMSEKDAEKRRREQESRSQTGRDPQIMDVTELQAELGVSQLDPDTLPAQLVEAAGVDPTRDPGAAYSVRGPAKRDFFSTAENAAAAHRQRFWATGDLPSGVNLQGVYATLGRIAAKGQPLQIVMSKQQGQTISPDVQKLLEAYQRRGFVLRTENTMAEGVPVQDSPYSQRVMARVLGTTGDNPAHAVLTLGDSQSAKLARRIGIPVIDLTNPVQQKIAGDILRAYDSSRRADISRSNDPAEVKAFKRKGEERTGTDRSRDLLTAGIEKALATNWNNPDMTQRLMRVGALAARVDNDFFDAGMAGREPIALANTIDALETYERQYNKENFSANTYIEVPRGREGIEYAALDAGMSVHKYRENVLKIYTDVVDQMLGGIVSVALVNDYNPVAASVSQKPGTKELEITVNEQMVAAHDNLATAYHESAHIAVTMVQARYGIDAAKRLVDMADTEVVHKAVIDAYGEEQAAYYLSNNEELFVEGYALWATGKLKLKDKSALQKIYAAVMTFFGKPQHFRDLVSAYSAMYNGELKKLDVKNDLSLVRAQMQRFLEGSDFFTYGAAGKPKKDHFEALAQKFVSETATQEEADDIIELVYASYGIHPSLFGTAVVIARTPGLSAQDRAGKLLNVANEYIDNRKARRAEWEALGADYVPFKPSLRMPGTEQTATEEQFDNARDYIEKVLPDDVRVIVRKMSTMSGLYSETELEDGDIDKFIELSAYAEDPMSVAHHESMHALVSALAEQQEQAPFIKALLKAANSPLVIGQLRSLLKNETQALEQMVNDPEERIAYMYEFWAAGKLNLASSVENWMVKLVRLVRGIFGVLDNNTKAGLYMAAFRDGQLKDPSAVNRVVMDSMSTPERVLRALPLAKKTERITRKVLETAHGRLKGYGNPALDKVADAFFADSSIGGQRSGYLQTVRDIVNLYGSQFAEIIRGSNEAELGDLAAALHSNKRPRNPELAERYDQTKALMRRLYNYMKASGIELPKVEDYFPQAWDKVAIEDNRQAFEDMLIENAQYRDKESGKLRNFTGVSAAAAAQTLLSNNGRLELTEDLAGFSPFMEASNERQIILKDRAKAAEYFDHDLVRIVTRYITQASKRGEYTRHFGQDGERLKGWLAEARAYGMTEEELQRDVSPAIRAMEGTLGHDINQYARDFMSGTMTVLNLAVLPLAVFSSLIDPMGIMVRGGTMEQSWNAFKAGVRNIPQSVRKEGKKLDIQDLAETIGTVESQNVLDMLGDMYGSAYMSDWARKTNNLMFRYNLMEGWNTAMRSAATVAALDFIERHAKGESKNSERWLDELGLSANTLVFDQQGKLVWKQADIAAELLRNGGDVSKAADISRRTREGITRWVDGAVLRPHAAHRPSWASDPRYMLIWHLKQFTYSFQKTILERVMHEARNGNYNPAIVLASYVPFMIAADYLRGLVQGAGEEPEWKKGQTFGEVVWEGTQRAGVLGVRQFAVDGGENPAFVLGPAANYALDAVEKTADGQVTDAIVQALPGNALWKGW